VEAVVVGETPMLQMVVEEAEVLAECLLIVLMLLLQEHIP
jgi:hypothetical protein